MRVSLLLDVCEDAERVRSCEGGREESDDGTTVTKSAVALSISLSVDEFLTAVDKSSGENCAWTKGSDQTVGLTVGLSNHHSTTHFASDVC